MKDTTLRIKTDKVRNRAIRIIETIPLDVLHIVEIREDKETLSSRQRRFYWLWLTKIAEYLGDTKDDRHLDYKKRFLTVIFERDNPQYALMVENIREVHRAGMESIAVSLYDDVVKLTSITDADTKQMTEFLNDIEKDAISLGITLPHPEDQRL